MIKPPTNVPHTLPRPPSTTASNEYSRRSGPAVGENGVLMPYITDASAITASTKPVTSAKKLRSLTPTSRAVQGSSATARACRPRCEWPISQLVPAKIATLITVETSGSSPIDTPPRSKPCSANSPA